MQMQKINISKVFLLFLSLGSVLGLALSGLSANILSATKTTKAAVSTTSRRTKRSDWLTELFKKQEQKKLAAFKKSLRTASFQWTNERSSRDTFGIANFVFDQTLINKPKTLLSWHLKGDYFTSSPLKKMTIGLDLSAITSKKLSMQLWKNKWTTVDHHGKSTTTPADPKPWTQIFSDFGTNLEGRAITIDVPQVSVPASASSKWFHSDEQKITETVKSFTFLGQKFETFWTVKVSKWVGTTFADSSFNIYFDFKIKNPQYGWAQNNQKKTRIAQIDKLWLRFSTSSGELSSQADYQTALKDKFQVKKVSGKYS